MCEICLGIVCDNFAKKKISLKNSEHILRWMVILQILHEVWKQNNIISFLLYKLEKYLSKKLQ